MILYTYVTVCARENDNVCILTMHDMRWQQAGSLNVCFTKEPYFGRFYFGRSLLQKGPYVGRDLLQKSPDILGCI